MNTINRHKFSDGTPIFPQSLEARLENIQKTYESPGAGESTATVAYEYFEGLLGIATDLVEERDKAVEHALVLKNDLLRTKNIAESHYAELFALRALVGDLRWALEELTATVEGECSRLLDEDRGGNGKFAVMLEEILARKPDNHLHTKVCEVLRFYAEQWHNNMIGTGEPGSTHIFKDPNVELLDDAGSKAQLLLMILTPVPKRS